MGPIDHEIVPASETLCVLNVMYVQVLHAYKMFDKMPRGKFIHVSCKLYTAFKGLNLSLLSDFLTCYA